MELISRSREERRKAMPLDVVILVVSVLIGVVSFVLAMVAYYKLHKRSRDQRRVEIDEAGQELLDRIQQIGEEELQKTEAGRELLATMKSEEGGRSC